MKTNIIIVLVLIIFYLLFFKTEEDFNDGLRYGDTGLPQNCRAIVKANYEGWVLKDYTAEEALGSINRNCGEFGYSWKPYEK
jgi:hypothetical protein